MGLSDWHSSKQWHSWQISAVFIIWKVEAWFIHVVVGRSS
jgi:hypothetical protein